MSYMTLQRYLISNLSVNYKYTCLEARKYKSWVSLSPSFELKPFYNHGCMILVKNSPVRPICNFLRKILWLPVRVRLLLNNWRNQSLYIITGLEMITLTRVYVNLLLSVNKKFVAYGTRVKILAILKNSCAKACYLIPKIEATIWNLLFSLMFWQYNFSFIIWLGEGIKTLK